MLTPDWLEIDCSKMEKIELPRVVFLFVGGLQRFSKAFGGKHMGKRRFWRLNIDGSKEMPSTSVARRAEACQRTVTNGTMKIEKMYSRKGQEHRQTVDCSGSVGKEGTEILSRNCC